MLKKKMHTRPRVGIALSGGAAFGIAHIGVLQAFADNQIPIDCIAGTSAGALVGAGFAFGISLEDMRTTAKQLSWSVVSSLPTSFLGIASNRTVEKRLEDFIGKKDIADADVPLAIVATDIESGEKIVFRKGKAALAARASACIPGLFTPVEIAGKKLVDGGLTENLPLSPLQDMGADIRIGVNVIRWHSHKEVKNIIDVMTNAVSILASHQRYVVPQNVDVLIEPDLGDYSPSDFKKQEEIIKEGYRAAVAKIPEIKALLAHPARTRKPKPQGMWQRFLAWLGE